MKRTPLAIIAVFTLFAQTLFAQNTNSGADSLRNAEVSIKFHNKTMYYTGNDESNPVDIHVTIKNTGDSTLRFKLADERMFSIDFEAYNLKNVKLEQTESLIRKRTTSQTVYFREIALQPNEEYSFVENLKDYLRIEESSIYYVILNFYPELYKKDDSIIKSKRLTLEIKPSPAAAASNSLLVEKGTVSVLQAEEIGPDKVVEQTIIARQQENWDKYFLYMDVEEMLKKNESRRIRYNSSSADERNEMIRKYKTDLRQNRIDNDIVASPTKFEIETTTYSKSRGTVTVIEWFNNKTFMEKKRYQYEVRQINGIWMIYDFSVTNLSSEAI